MKIIIAGDGKVGQLLTRQLSGEGHDLTLIDRNPNALESTIEKYDVMSVTGNCASMEVLRSAGVEEADLLITATGVDELNLLCCQTAHGMNPKIHTIARIRTPEYMDTIFTLRQTFGMSLVVNPEHQTAQEILRMIRYPEYLNRETFANGRVELVELQIREDSVLRDKKMNELPGIVKTQVLVCAVIREGKTVTPSGDFTLRAGDRIFVTGTGRNLEIMIRHIGVKVPRIRSVLLAGGGRSAYYVTKALAADGIAVKILEKDRERCERLAEVLPEATIVQADVALRADLDREDLESEDAVVAMTGLDELNLILSLYAQSVGVPKVITKLGRAENPELLDQLKVGSMVCPKELCSNTITRYVRAMANSVDAAVTVHSIAGGEAEATEFIVDENTRSRGIPLKEIRLKPNVLVASVARGSRIIFPNGETTFEIGDHVVLVSDSDTTIQQLNDIFA
ncbi:MAG: Trk system potassium transporter TrkA [Lachnospiraceae bacterium]|nr:Trk system potassium transporter TrkA [Lachnospiraceae bacterium]